MLNRTEAEIRTCGEAKAYCMINNGCWCCQVDSNKITVDMVQVAIGCQTFNKIYILKDAEYIKQWRNPATIKFVKNPVNIFHDPDKYPTMTKANAKRLRTGEDKVSTKTAKKNDVVKEAEALLKSLGLSI
jgi:hypothetical protein